MQHRTAPGHMDHGIHIDWGPAKLWVERMVREGKLAEVGLAAATLTILGWSIFAIHKALQSYEVLGPGFF